MPDRTNKSRNGEVSKGANVSLSHPRRVCVLTCSRVHIADLPFEQMIDGRGRLLLLIGVHGQQSLVQRADQREESCSVVELHKQIQVILEQHLEKVEIVERD